jgi:hypothetical protein
LNMNTAHPDDGLRTTSPGTVQPGGPAETLGLPGIQKNKRITKSLS